jgi:hypothetical protein
VLIGDLVLNSRGEPSGTGLRYLFVRTADQCARLIAMTTDLQILPDQPCLPARMIGMSASDQSASTPSDFARFVFLSPAPAHAWELAQNEGCDI